MPAYGLLVAPDQRPYYFFIFLFCFQSSFLIRHFVDRGCVSFLFKTIVLRYGSSTRSHYRTRSLPAQFGISARNGVLCMYYVGLNLAIQSPKKLLAEFSSRSTNYFFLDGTFSICLGSLKGSLSI
jgi:hypothetical protein